MKMVRFRIRNYKLFEDTGWISVKNPTVFVGENETGKSSLFRGLSKLNPSDNEKYDKLKEFPRSRFVAEEKKDWPVSSVEFELEEDDVKSLTTICPELKGVETVVVTRYYSWKLTVVFDKKSVKSIKNSELDTMLTKWHTKISSAKAPKAMGEELGILKQDILNFITTKQSIIRKNLWINIRNKEVNEIINYIMSKNNEEWQTKILKDIIKDVDKLKRYFEIQSQLSQARKYIQEKLPTFVYFDSYDVLDSAIHFPTFIQELKDIPNAPRVRTKKCLFEHVGMDLDRLVQLDITDTEKTTEELRRIADERSIRMNSASQIMTEKFSEWWEQKNHIFRYHIEGNFFRVWVSDENDPSEIELDQRSRGMQYFFSFYLVFLVESENIHKNSILLLDEPGLYIHASAQNKIVEFLEKVSELNQLVYSTHSPFMVNGDKLENVRILYFEGENKKPTISQDTWPSNERALFPLQAGLGYSIAQTLFYSKRQIVVEGLTDYYILKAMDYDLSKNNMTTLRKNAVIVPSGGTRNIMPLSSMLIAHDIKIVVLLDGDDAGKIKKKQLTDRLLVSTFLVSDFLGVSEAEIEDIFPEEVYLRAVYEAYPDGLYFPITFTKDEAKISCITKRIKKAFERMGLNDFEKWRSDEILANWIRTKPDEILNDKTRKIFQKIFRRVNTKLK